MNRLQKNLRLALFIVISSSIALGFPKRPVWIDTMPMKPHLYQGFGVADKSDSPEADRLRADQNAKTEIIQEISSTISSKVSSYYQEAIQTGDATTGENIEVFTTLSSDFAEATIEGIKIVDRYYDPKEGVYYSYATLLRSNFQSQMDRKAGDARFYAIERYKYANTAIQDGNISIALNHLSRALNHVLVAQSIVKKHLKGNLEGESGFLDTGLSNKIATLLHQTRFIKNSGDQQKGERNQALFGPLKGRVIFDYAGKEIPVAQAALSVSLEGAVAEFDSIIHSDQDGNFEVRIDKIISAAISNPKVSINFYLPQLSLVNSKDAADLSFLQTGGAHFNFKMDVLASIKIFVRILEEVNGERQVRSKSESTMIKALISQKYKVVDAMRISRSISVDDLDFSLYYEEYAELTKSLAPFANYAIVGLISSETSSTGTLNYARASAKLNVIDLETGIVLTSGSQSNIKAAGNTEKKANMSALRKCSNTAIADILKGLKTVLK